MVLTAAQVNSFAELINRGIGISIMNLTKRSSSVITFDKPKIQVVRLDDLKEELSPPFNDHDYTFRVLLSGEFSGFAELILPLQINSKLNSLLLGDGFDFTRMDLSNNDYLNEIANILLNSIGGEISILLDTYFQYHLPPESNTGIGNFLPQKPDINSFMLICESSFAVESIHFGFRIGITIGSKMFTKLKDVLESGSIFLNKF